jgi:hypothetical protein
MRSTTGGAPFVTSNSLPCASRSVAVVRLIDGSNGE